MFPSEVDTLILYNVPYKKSLAEADLIVSCVYDDFCFIKDIILVIAGSWILIDNKSISKSIVL